jgi:beta-N-acetylhexosaminidase
MFRQARIPVVVVLAIAALGTGYAVGRDQRPAGAAVGSGAGPAVVLAALTPAQRVGQLFMVGVPLSGSTASAAAAVTTYHAGSIFLAGRSSAGTAATRQLVSRFQALATPAATGGVPLLAGTDQEGGSVQTLSGPGFSTIPAALTQGTWPVGTLRTAAAGWGRQLAAAGVTVDLAPVLDTVPPGTAAGNPPIGAFRREYGTDPGTVARSGTAFLDGVRTAGVLPTAKHFPGLGRVTGNTDTTAGVTDPVTRRGDPYLAPFAAAVRRGTPLVMVSLATYARIDPARVAAFSPTVIGTMLRGDLGFRGVVVSDDLGNAVAVRSVPAGDRAVRFLAAGGDLVLTDNPAVVPAMTAAVLARYGSDATFRAGVDASVLRVLVAKQQAGLLGGAPAVAAVPGGRTVLQRATDDSLLVRDGSGTGWGSPRSVGGRLRYDPAGAGRPGTGQVNVAVVGTDGHVYSGAYAPGARAVGFGDLGGAASSGPAVASTAAEVTVAVRGGDGALWLRGYSAGRWGSWQTLGGLLGGAPALGYGPDGRLLAAIVGADGQAYQRVRTGGGWSAWTPLGGGLVGGPALAADPADGRLVLLGRGGDDAVWSRRGTGTGGWGAWTSLGGRVALPPAAAGRPGSAVTVLGEGLNGRVYERLAGGSWVQRF